MNHDKPTAAGLGWHVRETAYPFESPWITVREDSLYVRGQDKTMSYVASSPGVIVVPVTDDGRILLQRQYRYPIDDWLVELPAGSTFDRPDAPLEDVARSELEQELGAQARELRHIGSFYNSSGTSNERTHVFVAVGTHVQEQPERELLEDIELFPVSIREALDMARDGRIASGPSALALLRTEPLLLQQGSGPLTGSSSATGPGR